MRFNYPYCSDASGGSHSKYLRKILSTGLPDSKSSSLYNHLDATGKISSLAPFPNHCPEKQPLWKRGGGWLRAIYLCLPPPRQTSHPGRAKTLSSPPWIKIPGGGKVQDTLCPEQRRAAAKGPEKQVLGKVTAKGSKWKLDIILLSMEMIKGI